MDFFYKCVWEVANSDDAKRLTELNAMEKEDVEE